MGSINFNATFLGGFELSTLNMYCFIIRKTLSILFKGRVWGEENGCLSRKRSRITARGDMLRS